MFFLLSLKDHGHDTYCIHMGHWSLWAFLFSTVQSSCHHLPPAQRGDVPVSWQCFPSFWEEQCLQCCPSNHRSQNQPFHSYLSNTCNYHAEVLIKRLKSSFKCALLVFWRIKKRCYLCEDRRERKLMSGHLTDLQGENSTHFLQKCIIWITGKKQIFLCIIFSFESPYLHSYHF